LPEHRISATVRVPETSVWFSGHFPEDPVLPGIAQLFIVLQVIEKATKLSLVLQKVHRTKYRRVIRPEEEIEISVLPADNAEGQWRFELIVEKELACRGRLQAQFVE
ncbi:MAG: hypothetical protein KFF46_05760, partial [Desulfobacterales bacterium]|nr:hypothetical protein [Desulfobacterales bacterium]